MQENVQLPNENPLDPEEGKQKKKRGQTRDQFLKCSEPAEASQNATCWVKFA